MRKIILFSVVIFLSLSGCKKSSIAVNPGKELVLNAADDQMVTADNGFTFKLLNANLNASTAADNTLLSPLSVSMALSMTANGSSGATVTAMLQTLDFNNYTQDQVNTYNSNLITNLPELDPLTNLKIANSIWYKNTFTPLTTFLQTNANSYQATIQGLDFSSSSATGQINNWVSTQTNGKISTIVNQIPATAVMYLINAIYFKGTWKERFDPANTKPLSFTTGSGDVIQTNFMSGDLDFNTNNTAGATIAELPYGNSKYSMVFIMPAAGNSLQQYVAALDSAKWQTLMGSLSPVHSQISIPKFTFSYTVDLSSTLSSLGMSIAFSDAADFTRINAAGNLKISDVLHKTYVQVDEDGTTAAAATSVTIGISAVNESAYLFNRPFLFAIREVKSGLILFAGTMNNPTVTGN